MTDEQPAILTASEADEVAGILSALRKMASQATAPVVRACLEEAADDIAHLTGCRDQQQEEVSQAVA
jgi:hypothetical protein